MSRDTGREGRAAEVVARGPRLCVAHGCPAAASIDDTCRWHHGAAPAHWQAVTHYLRTHPRELRAADSLLVWGYVGPDKWRDAMATLNVPGARDAARDARHAYAAGNWLIGAMLDSAKAGSAA